MINIYEYLLSKNNAEIAEEPDEIKNWESMKELLNDFCNDSDEKDSGDEAIESLIEYIIEVEGINEDSIRKYVEKYKSQILKYLFDKGIIDEY